MQRPHRFGCHTNQQSKASAAHLLGHVFACKCAALADIKENTMNRNPSKSPSTLQPRANSRPKSKSKPKSKSPSATAKPKKKGERQQREARNRVAALTQVRMRSDVNRRLVGEVAYTRTWIDSVALSAEPLLHDLMWVEYRYMTPWARIELFHAAYVQAYLRAYAQHFDPIDLAKKRPLASSLAGCSPDEINALATATAHANALGVPYDIYCDVVMAGHLASDKWDQPPRPNQMYGKLVGPRMRERPTQAEIHARLLLPHWDARFFAATCHPDPVQEAAWKILADNVYASPDPVERLSEYLRDRRAISEVVARSIFGDDLVDEVIKHGGEPAPWWIHAAPQQRVPSCFGFPHQDMEGPCASCPVQDRCQQLASAAVGELIETTGTDDPRGAHKRKVDRDRQRRHRQKTRGGSDQTCIAAAVQQPAPSGVVVTQ